VVPSLESFLMIFLACFPVEVYEISFLAMPVFQLLIACTDLYETWYAYHGTLAYFNRLLNKALPSACVCVCVCVCLCVRRY
jgi:hypothetical protein